MGDSEDTRDAASQHVVSGPNKSTDDTSSPSPDIEAASYAELLSHAKQFLQDDSIKAAPREKQVAFLEQKGLRKEDIGRLLDGNDDQQPGSRLEMQTIHDSTTKSSTKESTQSTTHNHETRTESTPAVVQRDTPPIITYPEFLLKPQKPPPLVTFDRLLYATYGLAGLSALMYGASKYIVEPMLEALSDARHDLATKTLEDLEKFNQKLETTVSHIPYSATLAALKAKHDNEEDLESLDSDPTELFHRDIATQTSPRHSRTSSTDSSGKKTSLDVTNNQVSRLNSLHETLESLVSSVDPTNDPFLPPTSTKQLHDSVSQLQAMLDKLESTYNPFRSDYNSIYSSLSATSTNTGRDTNEAAKFKAEIRNLKGAFLSSRNFPAARPSSYGSTGGR